MRFPCALLAALLTAGCAVQRQSWESPAPAVADLVVRRAWPVMGTLLEIEVRGADSAVAEMALATARAAVFRVDMMMSVYKPASELSAVNRRAGGDSLTAVDPWTAEVLEAALRFAELSDGALDITVGPLVDAWGFHREVGAVPPEAALDSARRLVGYEQIRWDPVTRAVRLPRPGMRLDFGAIAKGFAVDRAVAALRTAGIRAGRVDLGGNLRWFGRVSTEGSERNVALRDPRDPDRPFALVQVDSGSVATSGDYERFFEVDGRRYSHILDPRSGQPVRGVAAVSVFAPTALEADALSTAFFVLGPQAGCRLAARLPGVEAVWVRDPDQDALRPHDVTLTAGLRGRVELAFERADGEAGPVFCAGEE